MAPLGQDDPHESRATRHDEGILASEGVQDDPGESRATRFDEGILASEEPVRAEIVSATDSHFADDFRDTSAVRSAVWGVIGALTMLGVSVVFLFAANFSFLNIQWASSGWAIYGPMTLCIIALGLLGLNAANLRYQRRQAYRIAKERFRLETVHHDALVAEADGIAAKIRLIGVDPRAAWDLPEHYDAIEERDSREGRRAAQEGPQATTAYLLSALEDVLTAAVDAGQAATVRAVADIHTAAVRSLAKRNN